MGGRGSGCWYRWDTRPIVEDYRCLDVNRWRRDGLLRPGYQFLWCWWRDSDKTEKLADINVFVANGRLLLSYRYRYGGGDWQDVTESVPLTWTPCNYGGRRPWFVCPGVVNGVACGRRMGKSCTGRGPISSAATATAWPTGASGRAGSTGPRGGQRRSACGWEGRHA